MIPFKFYAKFPVYLVMGNATPEQGGIRFTAEKVELIKVRNRIPIFTDEDLAERFVREMNIANVTAIPFPSGRDLADFLRDWNARYPCDGVMFDPRANVQTLVIEGPLDEFLQLIDSTGS